MECCGVVAVAVTLAADDGRYGVDDDDVCGRGVLVSMVVIMGWELCCECRAYLSRRGFEAALRELGGRCSL